MQVLTTLFVLWMIYGMFFSAYTVHKIFKIGHGRTHLGALIMGSVYSLATRALRPEWSFLDPLCASYFFYCTLAMLKVSSLDPELVSEQRARDSHFREMDTNDVLSRYPFLPRWRAIFFALVFVLVGLYIFPSRFFPDIFSEIR